MAWSYLAEKTVPRRIKDRLFVLFHNDVNCKLLSLFCSRSKCDTLQDSSDGRKIILLGVKFDQLAEGRYVVFITDRPNAKVILKVKQNWDKPVLF